MARSEGSVDPGGGKPGRKPPDPVFLTHDDLMRKFRVTHPINIIELHTCILRPAVQNPARKPKIEKLAPVVDNQYPDIEDSQNPLQTGPDTQLISKAD